MQEQITPSKGCPSFNSIHQDRDSFLFAFAKIAGRIPTYHLASIEYHSPFLFLDPYLSSLHVCCCYNILLHTSALYNTFPLYFTFFLLSFLKRNNNFASWDKGLLSAELNEAELKSQKSKLSINLPLSFRLYTSLLILTKNQDIIHY